MAEYIDKEAAIAEIERIYCKGCINYNGVKCRACNLQDAMDVLEDMPKADVVPVRRRSCKFCCGAGYTEEEFTVTTQLGRTVRTQFNFCPNCGRNLMGGADNGD